MAYCCQPYSCIALSWTSTGPHDWSFISQSLMNFEKNWWRRVATIAEGKDEVQVKKSLISGQLFLFYTANHNQQMKIILIHPLHFTQICKAGRTSREKLPIGEDAIHTAIVMQVLKHLPKVWMYSVHDLLLKVVGCQIYFKVAQYTTLFSRFQP